MNRQFNSADHSRHNGLAQPVHPSTVSLEAEERQLAEWELRLAQFASELATVTGDRKFAALKQDAQLRAKLSLARHRLTALEMASGENRLDAERSVESLWFELKVGFRSRDALALSLR